jgi:UDP-N-acetylmuramoylalanine--D-glutamate ligase
MSQLSGRFVLVLGLGESGLAMARWCARQGARLRIADTRVDPPGLAALREEIPGTTLVSGPFSEALLVDVTLVALSPGIDPAEPVVVEATRRGIPVAGEMTLFADALAALGVRERSTVIAITGTNGKTTTTALTAAMLRGAGCDAVAAGNISPSALAVLMARMDAGAALPGCWVLELSSFQLETMRGLHPQAATVLNVTDDHLDRHRSIEHYTQVKARIFEGDGVQVLNRHDPRVMAMAEAGRRVITIGPDRPASDSDYGVVDDGDGQWLVRGRERLIRVDQLKLAGLHNAVNALAALALGEATGAERAGMLRALRDFGGLPDRMALVARRRDGVLFYNDSKGTNVGATVAALQGLGRPVVLIAGGDGKGQDFSPLREVVARHTRAVVLIGRDAPLIEAVLGGLDVILVHAADMHEAVVRANALANPADAVLLSPACASFDMFRNYPHRAQVFIAAVQRLPEVVAA